jgi:xylulokinase
MRAVLTLDVGTTSVKTSLFDEGFATLAFSSREYDLLTPAKDRVELNPDTYWNAAAESIREVVGQSGVTPSDIAALTMTTQGETLIPVAADGAPLGNALVWIDARAVEETGIIAKSIGNDEFYFATGLPENGPACPVSKVLWLKRKRPEVFRETHKVLLLEDFLIARMTGAFVTNRSLVSSTGYYDINNNTYWGRALQTIGVTDSLFPEAAACGSVVGALNAAAAGELGLSASTVVTTGAMDQICSAIGAGNVRPGMVTETTGTALVIAATTAAPDCGTPARVPFYKHYDDNFLILPYCPTAAIVMKWFKDEFCGTESDDAAYAGVSVYQKLDEIAAAVPPGAGGVTVLPHFAGKLSPDTDPGARGAIHGLSLETKKGHIVRAIQESVAYMLRENLDLLSTMGISPSEIRSLGGGSRSSLWNQIKADVCGREILVMECEESTSLGAAMLGAVAVGVHRSVEQASREFVKVKMRCSPDTATTAVYDSGYRKYLDLYASTKGILRE